MVESAADAEGSDAVAPLRIALLGTRGVPARYGGFETAVEEIGAGLAARGHDVVVYCRGNDQQPYYRGMHRVVLPALRRKALETITHTGLSAVHAAVVHRPDVAVVFNSANSPYVGLLRAAGIPTALHFDGHDVKREKWRGVGQWYYRAANRIGVHLASAVIVDSQAIGRDLKDLYGVDTTYIPYGAERTNAGVVDVPAMLRAVRLTPGGYHLVVARFEPENHVLEIVQGYTSSDAKLPLVLVGFEGYPGEYTKQVLKVARHDARIRLAGPIWDQDLLDALYAGAASYIHGHSVGGTNPSLLRAIAKGAPIIAYDCTYNRETTSCAAAWFQTRAGVAIALSGDLLAGRRGPETPPVVYTWRYVVSAYEGLLHQVSGRAGGSRIRNIDGAHSGVRFLEREPQRETSNRA